MATINGTNGNNNISGTALADRIDGKRGNDTILAGDGADTIFGGDDNDLITGGFGNDQIDGGTGTDTAIFLGNAGAPSNRGVFVNLTNGTATGGDGTDTLVSIENVVASNFDDFITGSSGANRLTGNDGSDTFYATPGADTILGGNGLDAIRFSGMGAVTANIAAGSYSFAGGSGQFSGIELLFGGSNGDSLSGDGIANRLDGMAGNDTLRGGAGNDELWGGSGSDRLIGDGGNDTLNGNYSMFDGYGDNAADVFVVATNSGTVRIGDFKLGVDKLDLSHFGFNANGLSSYWTGSAVQSGFDTVMTLSGQNGESVSIILQGVVEGHKLALGDMIGGSGSLIAPPPTYPINGGNGVADIFVIDPQNGDVTINGFENGLDRMDISGFIHNGWGGHLASAPDGSAILEFYGPNNAHFSVSLPGHSTALIDPSDYIL